MPFKRSFYTLLLITFTYCLTAQEARLDWGNAYNEPANSVLTKIIHSDQNEFYGLRIQREGIAAGKADVFLEKYDQSSLNLKKSKPLELKYKNKMRDFEGVIALKGGQMFLLTSFNNQAKKKNYLFAQPISKKTMNTSSPLKMIAEVDTRNLYQEGGFRTHISKDTSKLLVVAMLPRKKKRPERFSVQVYDEQMNNLWSKEVTLPFDSDKFAVEKYTVDNNGNVYLLGVAYEDRSRYRRQGRPTYQYILLAYRKNGEQVEEYKTDLGDKFITDLTFKVARNGDLVFSGFYSEKGTYSVRGTYFFRLNPVTKEVSNRNLKEFDFRFLTEYLPPNKQEKALKAERKGDKKRSPELYQYSLDDLILRSDGGAVLIAEQYYVERLYNNFDPYSPWGYGWYGSRFNNPYFNPALADNRFEYNYNDIIVVNIEPGGEIEWSVRIPKQQITLNDGGYFSSYAMSTVRDKFYFVFNDHPKNYSSDDDRLYAYTGNRNSIITVAEVSIDGTVKMAPVIGNGEADIITRPKVSQQISRDQMLIYGERGRKFRFGKLTF